MQVAKDAHVRRSPVLGVPIHGGGPVPLCSEVADVDGACVPSMQTKHSLDGLSHGGSVACRYENVYEHRLSRGSLVASVLHGSRGTCLCDTSGFWDEQPFRSSCPFRLRCYWLFSDFLCLTGYGCPAAPFRYSTRRELTCGFLGCLPLRGSQ